MTYRNYIGRIPLILIFEISAMIDESTFLTEYQSPVYFKVTEPEEILNVLIDKVCNSTYTRFS